MTMIRRVRFHQLLAVVFGVAAAIPVIFLGFALHAYLGDRIKEDITHKNMLLAMSVRREIDVLLEHPSSLLRQMAENFDTDRFEGGLSKNEQTLLDSIVESSVGFETVFLLDRWGTVISISSQDRLALPEDEFIGLSMVGQEYFRFVKETSGTYWSNVASSTRSGDPSLTFSLPVGEGVIVGTLNLNRLDRIVAEMGAARGGEVWVTDKTGVLILSHDRARVAQGVNLGGWGIVESGLAGTEGTFEYEDESVEKLGSVVRVPKTGWLVVVSQNLVHAFAPLRRLEYISLAAVILSLAMATMAAVALSRRMTRPLSRLASDVRRVSSGDYGFSPEASGYVEIDDLATDFATMSENLSKRETEIRESEAKLRAVIDGSTASILLKDIDGRFLLANKVFAEHCGMSVDEIIGKTIAEVRDRSFADRSMKTDKKVIESGRVLEYEVSDLDPDGRKRDFFVAKFPIKNTQGEITGIGAVSTNVTERKQAESELREIAERVSALTGADFFEFLVSELAELMGVKIAMVGRVIPGSPSRVQSVSVHVVGGASEPITYDLPGSPCENVVGREACVYPSGVQQIFPDDQLLVEMNADGYAGAPLFDSQGAALGVIAVIDTKPIERVERCLATLRIFAARAAAELERKQAEDELRRSEADFHRLFDGIGSGAAIHEIICDAKGDPCDYRFIDVNPAFERLTQIPRENILGKTVLEVMPNTEQYWIDTFGRVALTGEPASLESFSREFDKYIDVVAFSPTPGQFAVTVTDVTERRRAEDALRSSEADLRGILDNMIDTFFRIDKEQAFLILSPSFETLFGVSTIECVGRRISDFFADPGSADELVAAMEKNNGRVEGFEVQAQRASSETFWLSITARQVMDDTGRVVGAEGIARDISQRKETEDVLRRSQRMEAIGQLTGGVAHDFNNLLGVIIGNLDFLKEILEVEEIAEKRISGALRAAWRGADLTKRLLAFARRDSETTVSVDLNASVEGMRAMLARTLTEKIEVHTDLSDGLWATEIDEGDLEDAILNLSINARDAMKDGGRLRIRTANVSVGPSDLNRYPNAVPGDYVEISVADTGCGMAPEVRDRVFEPFFTTKAAGEGTGLGLSMVYGFVRRSNGAIRIDSAPGEGTDVCVLLPRTVSKSEFAEKETSTSASVLGGRETVLVVDDEAELRRLVEDYLSRLGYKTMSAENAQQALGILESAEGIDLLFSDVVMPGGMSGEVLAEMAVRMRPGIKVLLTTGYSNEVAQGDGASTPSTEILPKPFRRDELAKRIRKMLDN